MALYWYEIAAKLGDKDAMMLSGWLYYKADDIPQNLELAKSWFQKASELGGDKEALQMVQLINEMIWK